jgi:hypothetical protein
MALLSTIPALNLYGVLKTDREDGPVLARGEVGMISRERARLFMVVNV